MANFRLLVEDVLRDFEGEYESTAHDPVEQDIDNLYNAMVSNDFSDRRYGNYMILNDGNAYYLLDDVVVMNGPACGFYTVNGVYKFDPKAVKRDEVALHLKKVADDIDDLLDYVDGTKAL